MVQGCLEWQARGLDPPPGVRQATDRYLSAQDAIARWIEEACMVGPDFTATTARLYASWRAWCQRTDEFAGAERRFVEQLEVRRFERWREGGTGRMGFRGLCPKPDEEPRWELEP
jgi:putative DNA primase/helicase